MTRRSDIVGKEHCHAGAVAVEQRAVVFSSGVLGAMAATQLGDLMRRLLPVVNGSFFVWQDNLLSGEVHGDVQGTTGTT